jgi:hypothetical protein
MAPHIALPANWCKGEELLKSYYKRSIFSYAGLPSPYENVFFVPNICLENYTSSTIKRPNVNPDVQKQATQIIISVNV